MTQLTDIIAFLQASAKELNRKKKQRKVIFSAITALMFIAVFAFILSESNRQKSLNLQEEITRTAKANGIATKAYTMLEHDPTLAFRLAEASYNIVPTPLNKQVIMASYANVPFYLKLEAAKQGSCRPVMYSPNGEYILTGTQSDNPRLWTKEGKMLVELKGHTSGQINSQSVIAFSSDSKFILTASTDSTARLWNIQGECLAVMKHNGAVNSVCFSPDGEKVLTASSDKTARVWDLKGNEIVKMEHEKGVRKAVFSPDGKMIASVSNDELLLWNMDGKLLNKYKNQSPVYCVSFSNSGKNILLGDVKGKSLIYDIQSKNIIPFEKEINHVMNVFYNHSDSLILTSHIKGELCLWDKNGKQIFQKSVHTSVCWGAVFSPSLSGDDRGGVIATASDDGTARIWDLEGNELMVLKGHTSQVFSAQFSPDGKQLVTASGDATARIWTIEPTENPIFKGHTGYVVDANFSEDGSRIVTAGWDYTARLWEKSGKLINTFLHKLHYGIDAAGYDDNNKLYSFNNSGEGVIYWNENGMPIDTLTTKETMTQSGFSYYQNLVLLNTMNNDLFVFVDKKCIDTLNGINGAKFVLNSKMFYSFNLDSSLYFWQQQHQTDSLHYKKFLQLKIPNTSFTSAEFSPSPFGEGRGGVSNRGGVSKWLITASEDSILRVWNIQFLLGSLNPNGELTVFGKDKALQEMKVNAILSSIVFSPTEEKFVSVSNDNIIRLWNLDGHVIAEMKGHSDGIQDVNFSHDGKYIASAALDKTVKLWNLEGEELMTYTGYGHKVKKAKFSPDNTYILSCSNDHTARLMPVSVEMVLEKINKEKVRGEVWRLGEKEMGVYGVK